MECDDCDVEKNREFETKSGKCICKVGFEETKTKGSDETECKVNFKCEEG